MHISRENPVGLSQVKPWGSLHVYSFAIVAGLITSLSRKRVNYVHSDRTTTENVNQTRQLEAAVWENEGERTWYNVSLTKSWKDGDDWKKTSASFGSEDLLPASKLLDWADFRIGQAHEKNEKGPNCKEAARVQKTRPKNAACSKSQFGTRRQMTETSTTFL